MLIYVDLILLDSLGVERTYGHVSLFLTPLPHVKTQVALKTFQEKECIYELP